MSLFPANTGNGNFRFARCLMGKGLEHMTSLVKRGQLKGIYVVFYSGKVIKGSLELTRGMGFIGGVVGLRSFRCRDMF